MVAPNAFQETLRFKRKDPFRDPRKSDLVSHSFRNCFNHKFTMLFWGFPGNPTFFANIAFPDFRKSDLVSHSSRNCSNHEFPMLFEDSQEKARFESVRFQKVTHTYSWRRHYEGLGCMGSPICKR